MLEIDLRAVTAAASGLENERKRVSVRSVRERLGGRGSHTTIGGFLQAWRRGEQPPAEVRRAHVPDAVAEAKQCYAAIEKRLAEMFAEQTRMGALLAEIARGVERIENRPSDNEGVQNGHACLKRARSLKFPEKCQDRFYDHRGRVSVKASSGPIMTRFSSYVDVMMRYTPE